MGPTLPAVDRYAHRRESQRNASELIKSFSERLQEKSEKKLEDAALKKRGIDVEGLRGETRAEVIAHDLAYGRKKNNIDLMREKDYDQDEDERPRGNNRTEPTNKKEKLSGSMGLEQEIEPKKGLYTQKTTRGELQPVKSFEQVQQEGIKKARYVSENGGLMSDQEGIALANQKNNEIITSNERIQGEEKALQSEKSNMNQRGQAIALGTIGEDKLTPEVANYFGKRAELLAEMVKTESDLDKALEGEIRAYKNAVAIAENSINEPERVGIGQDRLGPKAITDLKTKLEPLLKMGLYDKARDILSVKGYGPEERETIVSSLSESTNKTLGGMPKIPSKSKLEYKKGYPESISDYTPSERNMINDVVTETFANDPSANLILLRKAMREEKNVDWRAYKDGLDFAIYTGKLEMTPEQLQQYSKMSEPDETPLEGLLRAFGVGGK